MASKEQESGNERLTVALRIRPLREEERRRAAHIVVEKIDDKMVILADPEADRKNRALGKVRDTERRYVFDYAFGADSTQKEVYDFTTKPLIDYVLQGFNACVFAYGATSGGKTFTMVGNQDNPGCMVRALNDLFTTVRDAEDTKFNVTMSYLEIYNEIIRDLLKPTSGALELRDDAKGKGITVAGLSEIATESTQEVMKLLTKGNRERTQESTAANKTSSRSHALLIVNVKQSERARTDVKGNVKISRLYMIDLAGSERASYTQNKGQRLKEGAHINRSLLALGNVINALVEGKAKYVNYRDSKLTRLLKEALSGNCKTVMIANISPAHWQRDDSRNTLVYADRAKNISNKVTKNNLDVTFHVSQYQNIISELRGEIGRLKEKIAIETAAAVNGPRREVDQRQMEELKELRDEMVQNFREQMKLRHQLMKIDNHILSLSMEFERNNIKISEWETERATQRRERISERERLRKKKNAATKKKSRRRGSRAGGQEIDNEESGFEEEDEDSNGHNGHKKDIALNLNDKERAMLTSSDDDDPEYPADVQQAVDDCIAIRREQERYEGIKKDLEDDLIDVKRNGKRLEDELPKRISTQEEAEILSLLLKVHELEIEKVEIQSNALLKEHEVRRRDLLILKYDKQRTLSDEIILRQKMLIEEMKKKSHHHHHGHRGADGEGRDSRNSRNSPSPTPSEISGHQMPNPPELQEMYYLYQQELQQREDNETDATLLLEAKAIMRSPSMLSLRPELDHDGLREDNNLQKLPPINDSERLFESRTDLKDAAPPRSDSRLSLRSPESSAESSKGRSLPPISVTSSDPDPSSHAPSTSAADSDSATSRSSTAHHEFTSVKPLPPIQGTAFGYTGGHRRASSIGTSSDFNKAQPRSRKQALVITFLSYRTDQCLPYRIPRMNNQPNRLSTNNNDQRRRNSISGSPSRKKSMDKKPQPRFPSAPEEGQSKRIPLYKRSVQRKVSRPTPKPRAPLDSLSDISLSLAR